jgi:RNA polymerase sigma factor (sigma-70 family)
MGRDTKDVMEDSTLLRHQWIADHVLPWEVEVRRWLSRYTRTLSAHDIDDLMQEAYARLWSSDFSRVRNARKFLYSVVHNVLHDQLRRARVVRIESVAEVGALEIDQAPGPERWVSAWQQYEHVLRILKVLTPQRRTVYQLRKFEGLSLREIAQKLGLAEKTVENHLRLAQGQVIKALFASADLADHTSETDYERRRKRDGSKRDRS